MGGRAWQGGSEQLADRFGCQLVLTCADGGPHHHQGSRKECTLPYAYREIAEGQACEDDFNVLPAFLDILRSRGHIIQVRGMLGWGHRYSFGVCAGCVQCMVHYLLKMCGCCIEPELHALRDEEPVLCDQTGIGLEFFGDGDVLEAGPDVYSGHVSAVLHCVDNGVGVR